MPRRALLVTGGLGTGKTAVIGELVAIAEERGLAAAAVDLDWLGWATGVGLGPDQLIALNLKPVAENYAGAGIDRLALARGMVGGDHLRALRSALDGWELEVVRLTAPAAAARQRILARDSGAELETHLAELAAIEAGVAGAAVAAPAVENGSQPLREVALEVWRLGGWDA